MAGRLSTNDRSLTRGMPDAALFVALMATSVALGGALAHLFELPSKMGLDRDAYFTVQPIYAGWWQLAYVLAVQLGGLILVAWHWRRRRSVLAFAGTALACLFAAQVVFWVWTQPANAATRNWTVIPPGWEDLRAQWEYSHAAGALLQLCCMMFLVLATLASRSGGRCAPRPLAEGAESA